MLQNKVFLPDSKEQGKSIYAHYEDKALISTSIASLTAPDLALVITWCHLGLSGSSLLANVVHTIWVAQSSWPYVSVITVAKYARFKSVAQIVFDLSTIWETMLEQGNFLQSNVF